MKKVRRKHSASFKTEVALAAIRESESLHELSVRYGVSAQQISNWKREFLSRSTEIFSSKSPTDEASAHEKALYEKIGRLEMEIDFCKRASERLGMLKSAKH